MKTRATHRRLQADSGMILMYLHTVKDGSGDDRVACLLKLIERTGKVKVIFGLRSAVETEL
jgi:hypothetical protein